MWAVDPSGVGIDLAAKRIAASPVPVHAAGLDGARLDLPDDRFDSALSTMTLCTIPDVERALAELHRVLKPGAEFHFAEHGLAPEPKVARTQERFNRWQQRFAGGCHLDRDIAALLEAAGFEVDRGGELLSRGRSQGVELRVLGRAEPVRRRQGPEARSYTERSWRADRVAEGARLLSE